MRANLIVMVVFMVLSGLGQALPARAQESAAQTVEKTYCASATGYTDVDELKAALLASAKREAANEMFGELIAAFTSVENSVVISDQIRTTSVGFVRIQGDPQFGNGQALGEACVTVRAYVTVEDRAKFDPVLREKRHCIVRPELTVTQTREVARQEVVVQALIDYDRRLAERDAAEILPLMQKVEYLESGFVQDTESYCVRITGSIVPIEVIALLDATPIATPTATIVAVAVSPRPVSSNSRNASSDWDWGVWIFLGVFVFLAGLGVWKAIDWLRDL
ncbi:MAG: hypothetical protein IAE92_05680 [Burkholderiaceae bacterium]|nr:hypothetical protein [Burkholderiaceae bacterium]